MSLVGTRPPTVDEWEKYDLHHRVRLSVKPGISMMNWLQPKVFAVKHKIETIRAASRSGGIFTALSDTVLESKGVV